MSANSGVRRRRAKAAALRGLTAKAMRLHAAFAQAAVKAGRRPWTREQVMEGFVGDVGDLMKLVMAEAGARGIDGAREKLAHELADCLWSVLVLANLYGVELEREFDRMLRTVRGNATGPRRRGRRARR